MKLDAERRSRSIEELEGVDSGSPTDDSCLATTCHRLRRKPIGEFTVEDLRIMIGQGIGLFFLVPIALEVLERDPLASGDFYPGDLLNNVLRTDPDFWQRHQEWRTRLDRIVTGLTEVPVELREGLEEWRRWKE